MSERAADSFHPAAAFFYTVTLAVLSMVFFNPVFIALGFCFAVLQNLLLCGGRALLRQLLFTAPLCAVVAVFNPLVSHGGKTLLFYLFGSPVTLEATLYGVCSGVLLLSVLLWFSVYNRIVTPDRFLFLFSRAAPAASMLVTMTQRMVPLFSRRFFTVSAAQKTLRANGYAERIPARRIHARFTAGLKEISILLSWSMEEGLDTADSMKARGYGSAKRSAFSVYRFTRRDAAALACCAVLAVLCVAFYFASVRIFFYPTIHMQFGAGGWFSLAVYLLLAGALPLFEARWHLQWASRPCGEQFAISYRSTLYPSDADDQIPLSVR